MIDSQQQVTDKLLDITRSRYYGKYRGRVTSNVDPENRGRLEVEVPSLMRTEKLWAMPCVPFGGKGMGIYMMPEPGAGVWIEFEGGDISFPIWTGFYWAEGEAPSIEPQERMLYSEKGLSVSLNDKEETLTISDKTSGNIISIDVVQGKVTVKGSISVVIEAPSVQLGGEDAFQPVVKGAELMVYLTQLAAAAMPKSPVTPPLPPTPSILSTKVKTA